MSDPDAVHLHHQGLVELALRFAKERPGERAVALVAEGDVKDAGILGQGDEVVDRENAKQYLVDTAIRGLECLVDEGTGPVRELPVIHIARQGIRMESVRYEAPEWDR